MHRIDLIPRTDKRAHQFVEAMFAMPTLAAPAAILFGGDRWSCVEVVALLNVNGVDAGMATLAPTDEIGIGGPHIIGLWIDPEFKCNSQYQRYGVEMLQLLADESIKRYQQQAMFLPITATEHELAKAAKEQLVKINVRDVGGPHANW